MQRSVQVAHQNLISSRNLYYAAQQLLDTELGLDKLSFQKPVGYTAQFSELEQSRRSDAEYHNPMAEQIGKRITTLPHTTVRDSFNVGGGFPSGIVRSSYQITLVSLWCESEISDQAILPQMN